MQMKQPSDQSVHAGVMQLNHGKSTCTCAACGDPCSGQTFAAKNVAGPGYATFRCCESCGTLRVLDEVNYDDLYKSRDSTNYSCSRPGAARSLLTRLKQWYLQQTIPSLVRRTRRNARIVDYGCGGGELANALIACGFKNVYALDVQASRPTRLVAEVTYRPIQELRYCGVLDLVLLRHVVEHLVEPSGTLNMIRRSLAPGAQVIVEVPNEGSIFRVLLGARWPGYFFPYHAHVFSLKGLTALARRCGYSVLESGPANPPILGVFLIGLGLPREIARVVSICLYPLQWLVSRITGRPEAVRVILKSPGADSPK